MSAKIKQFPTESNWFKQEYVSKECSGMLAQPVVTRGGHACFFGAVALKACSLIGSASATFFKKRGMNNNEYR